jgi:D-glycero-D-manno-heptose 1,7-bisphosphate phosphatase
MLLRAAREHGIDIGRSIMIGDALTDLAAGQAAGVAHTILLRTGRGQAQLQLPLYFLKRLTGNGKLFTVY